MEVLPTDLMSPSDDIVAERMNTLERMLAARDAGAPLHVANPARGHAVRADRRRLREETPPLREGESTTWTTCWRAW